MFLTVEDEKFSDRWVKEARTIHVVTAETREHQYEPMFCLVQMMPYVKICINAHVHRLVHTHLFPCFVS
jgi:hypothetical protein